MGIIAIKFSNSDPLGGGGKTWRLSDAWHSGKAARIDWEKSAKSVFSIVVSVCFFREENIASFIQLMKFRGDHLSRLMKQKAFRWHRFTENTETIIILIGSLLLSDQIKAY